MRWRRLPRRPWPPPLRRNPEDEVNTLERRFLAGAASPLELDHLDRLYERRGIVDRLTGLVRSGAPSPARELLRGYYARRMAHAIQEGDDPELPPKDLWRALWSTPRSEEIRRFLTEAIFPAGRAQGEVLDGGILRLDDQDTAFLGIVFQEVGFGPHAGHVYVDQNRYHASEETAQQRADETLEDFLVVYMDAEDQEEYWAAMEEGHNQISGTIRWYQTPGLSPTEAAAALVDTPWTTPVATLSGTTEQVVTIWPEEDE